MLAATRWRTPSTAPKSPTVSTVLTHIHHRQTPLWIMQGKAQAGVTWQSEAMFQEQAGHPIESRGHSRGRQHDGDLCGAMTAHAPHVEAARRWLDFIHSPAGLTIFERYGFKPYEAKAS